MRKTARGVAKEGPGTEVMVRMNHDAAVLENRQSYFADLGFDDVMAALLAHSNISPHGMQDLLDKGCPPETAVHILMGTDANGLDDPTASVPLVMEDDEEDPA